MAESESHRYSIAGRNVTDELLAHLGIGVVAVLLLVATGSFHVPHALVAAPGVAFVGMLFATFSWAAWNIVAPTMAENTSL